MKNLLFILVFPLFIGCKSTMDGIVIDSVIRVFISDETGNDLLDPSNEGDNAIKEISVYYVNGNTEELVYHLTDRNEFAVHSSAYGDLVEEDAYYFPLICNYISSEKETSLIVEWNKLSRDTIRCKWLEYDDTIVNRTRECHEIVTKVYLNDELKWETEMHTPRSIHLVK